MNESLPPPSGLRERFGSGLVWVGGSFGAIRLLGLVQTVILARLLSPGDFGAYAMVALTTGTVGIMTGFGMREAVIQSRHETRSLLDSAFCLGLGLGLLKYGIAWTIAPWIEVFFGSPALTEMIRVAGLSFLLGSVNNVGLVLYAKELDYRRSALYSHVPQLFSMAVSVGLAVWLRSAWALVLAQVAAASVMLPLSYWAHPFRPRLRPRREALLHLLRYGRYVAGSAPLFYLSGKIDDVVVGRRFGSHSLGAYHVAYNTSALPAIYFSEVILSIAFPILARLQGDPKRLAGVYKQTLRHVANVALPSAVLLWLLAPELIRALYGGKWEDAAPLLAAFALYGALRSVAGIPFQLYRAIGRTDLLMRFGFLNLLVVGWVVLVASAYGPFWMAVLLSVMSVPVALYGFDLSAEILGVSRREIRGALSGGWIASLGAGLVAWAVLLAFDGGIVGSLVVGAATFAPVYVAILTALDRRWLPELRDMLGAIRKA